MVPYSQKVGNQNNIRHSSNGIPEPNVVMRPQTEVQRVTPGQMKAELDKRANRNIDMGNKLLNRCYRTIKNVGVGLRERFCIYKIPIVELEMGGCDKNKIILYLCHDLTNNGYQVEFFQPNMLFIRWNLSQKNNSGRIAPPAYKQLTYNSTPNSYRSIDGFQKNTPSQQFRTSGQQPQVTQNPYNMNQIHRQNPRLPDNKSDFPLLF